MWSPDDPPVFASCMICLIDFSEHVEGAGGLSAHFLKASPRVKLVTVAIVQLGELVMCS